MTQLKLRWLIKFKIIFKIKITSQQKWNSLLTWLQSNMIYVLLILWFAIVLQSFGSKGEYNCSFSFEINLKYQWMQSNLTTFRRPKRLVHRLLWDRGIRVEAEYESLNKWKGSLLIKYEMMMLIIGLGIGEHKTGAEKRARRSKKNQSEWY